MNRHIHADKIITKAENMDLVVLVKHGTKSNPNWLVTNDKNSINFPIWDKGSDYFLCHEEHREACLHWLNGNMVEVFRNDEWLKVSLSYVEWTSASLFMNSETSIRIKPKKEKRYIAILSWPDNSEYIVPNSFESKDRLIEHIDFHYGKDISSQIIEIEVEV